MKKTFTVTPIGKVNRDGDDYWIDVFPQYRDGLKGLEQFSHVTVLFWCHEKDGPDHRNLLQVHPCGNPANPLTGVFATRSPARPNPAAVTVCRLLQVQPDRIEVAEIDAYHQSPVIDIKGYFPPTPTGERITTPTWQS